MGSEVEAVDSVAQQPPRVQIEDVTSDVSQNAPKAEALSSTLDAAMSRALSLPGGMASAGDVRGELKSGPTGAVGAEKDDFVSDSARDGVAAAPADTDAEMTPLQQRLQSLYKEMTNWQVAWAVAQRTQQDTSHLLKGN